MNTIQDGINLRGDNNMYKPKADLVGRKFGRLLVISVTGKRDHGSVVQLCKCDCGTFKEVSRNALVAGSTKSCGCYAIEKWKEPKIAQRLSLVGKIFDRLTVTKFLGMRDCGGRKFTYWLCRCVCGNESQVFGQSLTAGNTSSCGCSRKIDILTGQKFGRWTVLSLAPERENLTQQARWICKCTCGNIREITGHRLVSGKTNSCGCYAGELRSARSLHLTKDPTYKRRNYLKHKERRLKEAQTPKARFKFSIQAARKREIFWEIAYQDYFQLISKPCYYCETSLSLETGVGLDRINNDKTIGYKLENVLPCCGLCNITRQDNFTVEEFKIMMQAVIKFRNDKKNSH